jgi:ATP-dependent RNA helicase DHX57
MLNRPKSLSASTHYLFASPAGLKQRRGRAGRVREGTCYKLISRRTHATLREHGEPEIQRSALDQTILSLLFLGMDCNPTAGGFLDSLLDPPSTVSSICSRSFVWRFPGK